MCTMEWKEVNPEQNKDLVAEFLELENESNE